MEAIPFGECWEGCNAEAPAEAFQSGAALCEEEAMDQAPPDRKEEGGKSSDKSEEVGSKSSEKSEEESEAESEGRGEGSKGPPKSLLKTLP